MTTLDTQPLQGLLAQLFSDAEASDAKMDEEMKHVPREEVARRAGSPDYRAFYMRAKDYHLAVSPETAKLLYLLARGSGATSIVEFGTSFGISTLHLAAALKDNGGGRLIGSEFEPSKVVRAKDNLRVAGLHNFTDIREGDALETLASGLPDKIDFLLLDGAKQLYLKILRMLEPRLKAGALIVADNANWCPEYLAHVRSSDGGYLSLPFAEDVELSMKVGLSG